MKQHPLTSAILAIIVIAACGSPSPNPDDRARADSLQRELSRLQQAQRGPVENPATSSQPAAVPVAGASSNVVVLAPAEPGTVTDLEQGAVLDLWLNNREGDLKALTIDRSVGSMIATSDFFRYNHINSDQDLRGYWGRPLLMKWSALLEITESGAHVFSFELKRQQDPNRLDGSRTLVTLNGETVFQAQKEYAYDEFSEMGSAVLSLSPGFYRLEVWLAAGTPHVVPSTDLGTYIKVREPSSMTPQPLQSSRIWHRAP
ncbi:hypothetical protein [Longimicrobium terrae]|uniref:Uncharacterized protein n=1 Tax=Longimicrobium terrae TaxID=1639882 RepID=A0A841H2U9_9BACT|nr:hypothetical protein [Longimicrobium terrae]MBB4637847.1 hypothetical protein [Longimicrobium terrae]MBB6072298.1 hypothetical protein [Longimicrobium terrae]NNC31218.1 hypothetical protein [Longimicrobium terrae]